MQRISRRGFNSGLLAGAGLLGSGLVGMGSSLAAAPQRGGSYTVGLRGGNTGESLNPATYGTGIINHFMTGAIGNCLAEIDADGKAIPELAESWEASPDAATWIFRLRPGVTFHNGKPLTQDDVIASFNFHRGDDSTSGGKPLLSAVKDIRKDGERNVVFELEGGNADFPYVTTPYFFIIFPSVDGTIDWQSGVSTGGYKLVEFDPGVRYLGERNPDYWKEGHANFDSVEVIGINDAGTRTTALVTGEVDAIGSFDLKTVNLLKRNKNVEIVAVTGTQHYSMPMFCDTAPFDNVDVRLALKYGIDRQALVDTLLQGYGQVGNDSPITPANRYFNAEMEQRTYDPERAKHHLKKAGMDTLSVDLHTSDAAFSGAVDAAVLYSEQAKKAGIDINVVQEPADGYWTNVWRKKPFCTCFWSGRPTEDLMFSIAYETGAQWNDARWSNPGFDALLKEARTELDEAKRRSMYYDMQEIVRDDGGTVIPVYAQYVYAHGPGIGKPAKLGGNRSLDGWKSMDRWWRTDV